ncbi:uncharacterized protein LOC113333638 [Papaver somniferum]|uniref:uncharacterized protein LOC113333638 n=1 Tax=Papaver somniferum TaxID=3469 RepID=UPI000E704328|nr:uncharacterized protein LOC113333638 [Papaver somniferum]
MVEDYLSSSNTNTTSLSVRILHELNLILKQHDKVISMYDIPPIVGTLDEDFEISILIQEDLSIPIFEEHLSFVNKLNEDQYRAYSTIMRSIERKESKVFFIYGPGGTGKTFLYRVILATVKKTDGIAIATTTSRIIATMLPGGRETHSRFHLPMTLTSTSICRTIKQSEKSKLRRHATVLIWDEATIVHRYSLEAFYRTMRDITYITKPFGGKILIMGVDFSQKNMRADGDASYSEFLIRVGDGDEPCIANEMINVPEEMVIPWVSDDLLSQLIDVTFPNLVENAGDTDYIVNKALITPLNEYVEKINDRVLGIFPGKEVIFYSFDYVDVDTHGLYQQEYLKTLLQGVYHHTF